MPEGITRRSALALGGAVVAGRTLGVQPPALALEGPPACVAFGLALPEVARSARRGELLTGVLRAPARFDLVGVTWKSGRPGRIELRTRRRGGRWTEWFPAAAGAEHAPDGVSRPRVSEPVWVGGADEIQLRLERGLGGARLELVNATGTASGSARLATTLRSLATAAREVVAPPPPPARAAGAPQIVPREAWADASCTPRVPPSYGEVQVAFVHHTVGRNDYAPEESAAIVRAICTYHRNRLGWNDVGYNFLVDRHGQVFEGRAGGVDQAVIGAQAQGYNSHSTGIACLGTFGQERVPAPALEAIAQLIGWKLPLHGVPVTGEVVIVSGGGDVNRYPSGRPVTFSRISGHRDADNTECPGAGLYGQLGELRSRAAALAAPVAALTIGADRQKATYRDVVGVGGRLARPDGTPHAGVTVELQSRGSSGYRTIARSTTAGDGTWSVSLRATKDRQLRARFGGDGVLGPLTSRALTVVVVPDVTARAAPRVTVGRSVRLGGRMRPAKRYVGVVVERAGRNGRWHRVAARTVRARGGRYQLNVRLSRAALYRIRVRVDAGRAAGVARAPDVFVRAVRGDRVTGGTAARAE